MVDLGNSTKHKKAKIRLTGSDLRSPSLIVVSYGNMQDPSLKFVPNCRLAQVKFICRRYEIKVGYMHEETYVSRVENSIKNVLSFLTKL
jgi:hypothetical protein